MSLLFHWGDIVEKVLAKVGVWKRDEKGGWPYIGGSIGRGVQNFYTLCICGFCSWNIIITTKILILENNYLTILTEVNLLNENELIILNLFPNLITQTLV